MPQLNMVQAIGDALRVEMRRNDRVIVLVKTSARWGRVPGYPGATRRVR